MKLDANFVGYVFNSKEESIILDLRKDLAAQKIKPATTIGLRIRYDIVCLVSPDRLGRETQVGTSASPATICKYQKLQSAVSRGSLFSFSKRKTITTTPTQPQLYPADPGCATLMIDSAPMSLTQIGKCERYQINMPSTTSRSETTGTNHRTSRSSLLENSRPKANSDIL
jgi:hypothetical protein